MKIKILTMNQNGKIEITPEDLEILLQEIREEGFKEGIDYMRKKGTSNEKTSETVPRVNESVNINVNKDIAENYSKQIGSFIKALDKEFNLDYFNAVPYKAPKKKNSFDELRMELSEL